MESARTGDKRKPSGKEKKTKYFSETHFLYFWTYHCGSGSQTTKKKERL
jgi:hypothetical protein